MTRNMKWITFLGVWLLAAVQVEAQGPLFSTQKEKVSYGIGVGVARDIKTQALEIDSSLMIKALKEELSGKKPVISDMDLRRMTTLFFNVAKNIMNQGVELDLELMIRGLEDELSGKKLLIPERDIRRMMIMFQVELKRLRPERMINTAEDNLRKGDSFLTENKNKEGVVALPSGLQYKILKAGDGKKPTDADLVECHYQGSFINGTEFESSYRYGHPVTLKVLRAIPGWREALKLMPAGSKWQLFIPPHLAYGLGGRGNDIGPNETLIFELELLAVK